MGLEANFLDMMPDTVTVYPKSSVDNYGKRTWSATGTSYRCRIQASNDLMRTDDGRDVIITATIYLYGSPSLTTDHRLVMPDGSTPIIISTNTNNDQAGAHHTVIKVGR